uniref:Secreted protein n=1 Tax=Meloidogyne hapla TaxID=6305 RepID=A0A1I8B857_MELHA
MSLNKCCRLPFLFSGKQSFSLTTIILLGILLAGQIGFSSALRCYQVSGSPTDCGYTSFSCIKVVDFSQVS